MKNRFPLSEGFTVVLLVSVLGLWQFQRLELLNIAMLYLIPVILSALRHGRMMTLFVSIIAVLALDILFVHPRFTFAVSDSRYFLSFAIMIAVGQLIAYLVEKAAHAKELETSERLQETLLGSLSHELRTPLAAIMGASSGLLTQELNLNSEQKQELYQTIDSGAQRMRRLIDNLLDTARLQSGVLKIKDQECDIPELLGSALAKAEHTITATLMIDKDVPQIRGDTVLIELALFNLLDNAFKYGNTVNVAVSREAFGIMIRICNTGSIPPAHEASMAWRAFSRLSNVRGEEGIGLGLYVAYKIAKMHGGEVETMSDGIQFCATMKLPERGEG
ncbi:MAG: DUF4118 domain-containing protein [Sulfuricurvum sp.]|nr:DUF4118 domain-containing protein [Sulfuricurvum sp.]MDD5386892.1 DUF4118 domain-containing protein [Sulfuricurvum sp.]